MRTFGSSKICGVDIYVFVFSKENRFEQPACQSFRFQDNYAVKESENRGKTVVILYEDDNCNHRQLKILKEQLMRQVCICGCYQIYYKYLR